MSVIEVGGGVDGELAVLPMELSNGPIDVPLLFSATSVVLTVGFGVLPLLEASGLGLVMLILLEVFGLAVLLLPLIIPLKASNKPTVNPSYFDN